VAIEYCVVVQSKIMVLSLFADVFFSVVGLWCFIVIYQTFKKRDENLKKMPKRYRGINGKISHKL
tara:strand:+ start:7550 stop:7744 length:195 start_codon:yes stop_codon:yes gene_type:complete